MFASCFLNITFWFLIITLLVILYFKRCFSYWESKGVATIKPSIPFGNMWDVITSTVHFELIWKQFYNEFKKQGVRYGGIYFCNRKVFMPIDPELIKAITTKDFTSFMNHGFYYDEKTDPLSGHLFSIEGNFWKKVRSQVSPTFTTSKMKMMFSNLLVFTISLNNVLGDAAETLKEIDIKEVMACFTTDVIASIAFGINVNSLENPDSEFREIGKLIFGQTVLSKLKFFSSYFLPWKFLQKVGYKLTRREVEDFFMNLVRRNVEHREKNNIYRKDFLHLLIQLKNIGRVTDDGRLTSDNKEAECLSFNQVVAQAYMFYAAGFETSSSTGAFGAFELASYPEIQQKLREEVREVFNKYHGFTYDSFRDMPYMDKVVFETLRKYPIGGIIPRVCSKDYKVPNSEVTIEKGTFVAIPVQGIHHDHEYYPDPMVFDPERFSNDKKSKIFLAFGDGPRVCIGKRFALMQLKLALATLVKDYELTLSTKTSLPIEYSTEGLFTLTPKHPIYLNVRKLPK